MKVFLQSIFLFCFIFASGQKLVLSGKTSKSKTFHFDYLVHYTSESEGKTRDVLGYINSENPNYVLKIFKSSNTDIFAKLFSEEDKETFNFKVKQTKLKGEIIFEFEYEDSFFLGYKAFKKPIYRFSKIDDNTLKFDIFKNKKETKIVESHTMKIKSYNQPLYSAYKVFFVHHCELGQEMQFPENIFVEESVVDCGNGKILNIKLQEIKKVNLDLTIP